MGEPGGIADGENDQEGGHELAEEIHADGHPHVPLHGVENRVAGGVEPVLSDFYRPQTFNHAGALGNVGSKAGKPGLCLAAGCGHPGDGPRGECRGTGGQQRTHGQEQGDRQGYGGDTEGRTDEIADHHDGKSSDFPHIGAGFRVRIDGA